MLRMMSFLDEAAGKELVLPVTPAKYLWRHPNRVERVRLDQEGEATLPAGGGMGSCTLEDVLLPAQVYPFCVPGARADPWGYLYDLEVWSDRGTRLRWIVSGTSINAAVLIEEVTQGERDGSNDLYVSITMRQCRTLEAPVVVIPGGAEPEELSQGGGTAAAGTAGYELQAQRRAVSAAEEAWGTPVRLVQPARAAETGASSAKTYTVEPGDSLWSVSERFYGRGDNWQRLAAANPHITNPNLIVPGMVLTIPAARDLPGAVGLPASAALAGQIASVWDGEKWTLK